MECAVRSWNRKGTLVRLAEVGGVVVDSREVEAREAEEEDREKLEVLAREAIEGEGEMAGESSLKRSWMMLMMFGQCSVGEFSVGKLKMEGNKLRPVGGV